MSDTRVPTSVVITKVKIELSKKLGMYLLRSMETGRMAVSKSRTVLRTIAERQGWMIVRAWS